MIRGLTFNLQEFKSADHAHEVNHYYGGDLGVTKGCAVTENVDGNLVVADGYFIIYGRLVNVMGTEIITVPVVASGTLYSTLVFEIDLTQENTAEAFNQGTFKILSDAADYPTLTQEDLDDGGEVYQLEFARFENTVAGIGSLTDTRTMLDMDKYLQIEDITLSTTETITVGSGGQYATINEALAYATQKYPVYVSASVRPRITIQLLTGFVMAEQVIVDGQDLSWITISSVDSEVVITRSALTIANANGQYPAFTSQNGGFTPIIDVLFNMDSSGTSTDRHGLMAFNNSRAIINSGKGFKNVGGSGIFAKESSIINANGAIASGAAQYGVYAFRSSTINANGAIATGVGNFGIVANESSTINAPNSDVSGKGYYGYYALQNSTINANHGTANNVGTTTSHFAVFANNACMIDLDGGSATNCSGTAIYARRNSTINVAGVNASGAGNVGIASEQCSNISAFSANARKGASDSTSDFAVSYGGIIEASARTGGVSQTVNTLTTNGIIFG